MKNVIKWVFIGIGALLALTIVFTAVFFVVPLSQSIKNIQKKLNEPSAVVVQTTEPLPVTTAPAAPETTVPVTPEETTSQPEDSAARMTEYDIYRTGKFYITGTVTDSDGHPNPMEMAITDGSVYMLTAASGVQMGVMIGGGKTYLVSPEHKAYLELSSSVMSLLKLDPEKISAPASFNFSDMKPLAEADEVKETELNGVKCTEYVFSSADGKRTSVYMDGDRLLQADMFSEDGSLYNRMTFESVSAEIPADKIAPPTYYTKKGMLSFIALVSKGISE